MEATMTFILQLIALLSIIAGTAFSVIGVLGYIRLPDIYSRLHATGKVGVFGVVLLLVAALGLSLLGLGKGLVLMIMLLASGPAVSHALSSAAYRIGIPVQQSSSDALKTYVEGRKRKQ